MQAERLAEVLVEHPDTDISQFKSDLIKALTRLRDRTHITNWCYINEILHLLSGKDRKPKMPLSGDEPRAIGTKIVIGYYYPASKLVITSSNPGEFNKLPDMEARLFARLLGESGVSFTYEQLSMSIGCTPRALRQHISNIRAVLGDQPYVVIENNRDGYCLYDSPDQRNREKEGPDLETTYLRYKRMRIYETT